MHTALFPGIPMLSILAAALPRQAAPAPVAAPVATPAPCARCNGSGRFVGRNGRELGNCFTCTGSGKGKAAAVPAASVAVDDGALRAAFDRAQVGRLRAPRITLGSITVKPAKASSSNPGALYVTEGETYLGKVLAGRFQRSAACSAEQADTVAALMADPKGTAEAYGKETGVCCICRLTLTDPDSISRGIGPICASKFGF